MAEKTKTKPAAPFTIEVPETLLKKRKISEAHKEAQDKKRSDTHKKRQERRDVIFKRAEKYVKEYRQKEKDLVETKRAARRAGDLYVPGQAKLYFIIRIKGVNHIPPKPRKILQLFRLLQINNGVFIRVTKATAMMLKYIEPYIAYGSLTSSSTSSEPNLKTVRELIYKRGFGKLDKQRIPLSDNHVVESRLGKLDILSIEDLIHEIYTVGPNFKQANNFLWPFKLNNPTGGWRTRKFKHYVEGGDFGNREDKINALVRSMV
ncbi:60S ribosomal protein L7 [Tulasnella sp. 427]|nr:60S ribosomal protein L7 [Tulasnella sp. 427]